MLNLIGMRFTIVLIAGLLAAGNAFSQSGPFSAGQLPKLRLVYSQGLQESLYPEIYKRESASKDMTWVVRNDSLVESFVAQSGDSVMSSILRLTGFLLRPDTVDITVVRFYPSTGSAQPLIFPLGGIRTAERTIALPTGIRQTFNLLFQISRWAVAEAAGDTRVKGSIVDHPLMRQGVWQSDNIAMLLTLTLSEQFFGADSTAAIWVSPFWRNNFVSWDACNIFLRNNWKLSHDKPLLRWLDDEPWDSDLVKAFAPPKNETTQMLSATADAGIPSEGIMGFTLVSEEKNVYRIGKIDSTRLAFACGLRQGDKILRAGSDPSSNQSQLIGKILEGYDRGAMTVYIKRGNKTLPIIIRPLNMEKDSAG